MDAFIQDILDRELDDFAGARLAGKLSASDALVNELLGLLRQQLTPDSERNNMTNEVAASPDTEIAFDLSRLIQRLRINTLAYATEAGRTTLELDVQLPPRESR